MDQQIVDEGHAGGHRGEWRRRQRLRDQARRFPGDGGRAAGILVRMGGTYFTVQATHKTKTSDALVQSVTDLAKKAASKLQ